MLSTAEVYMWGTRIGIVHLENGKAFAAFEYDRDFLKSHIEVSPLYMPLSGRVYEFPDLVGEAFHGVPGMLSDSLPDKFGNAVINQWLVSQGRSLHEFNAIDRLCYTGERAMGALEYIPANGPHNEIDESINVAEMVRFASDVLYKRKNAMTHMSDEITYGQLVQLGTSAGGARAKAVIAWNEKTNDIRSGQICLDKDYDYWLIKFDGVSNNGDHGLEDKPEYTLIEYVYHKMAVRAGIHMSDCRLLSENGRNHFMTKRFDRVNGKKVHMQTLGALAHIDYNIPGLCSYEQAAGIMKQMHLKASEIEELYRRMVFNVIAVNQDDHVKNISFLMDKKGTWSLSPAYDITFAYNANNRWLAAHQMFINGKKDHITREDLLQCGKNMDISTRRCNTIIEQVKTATEDWMEIAQENGIREQTAELIRKQQNNTKLT